MRSSTAVVLYLLPAACFAAISVPIHKTLDKRRDNETASKQKRTSVPETLPVGAGIRELLNGTVGTPGESMSWFADTGSSDVWVIDSSSSTCQIDGCPYGSFTPSKSSTYVLTEKDGFKASYGTGYGASGDRFNDTLALPGASIQNCNLGLANAFHDENGNSVAADIFEVGQQIFGLSYVSASTPNNVITQMVQQRFIDRPAFSVWAGPSDTTEGELTFGGVDTSKYTGSLIGVGIQEDETGNYTSLSVAMTDMSLLDVNGNRHELQPSDYAGCSMLLDTGSPKALHLPTELMAQIIPALGVSDENGTWAVPCELKQSQAQISFQFGGNNGPVIRLPVSILVGRQLTVPFVTVDGTMVDGCELSEVVYDKDHGNSHQGILGLNWAHWAYMVFDLQNNVIALAQLNEDGAASSNIQNIDSGSMIPGVAQTVQYQVPSDVRTSSGYAGTPAATTVRGTATGYPCVAPMYDLGVDVCKNHPTSSTTTAAATVSNSPSTTMQQTTMITATQTSSTVTDVSTTTSQILTTPSMGSNSWLKWSQWAWWKPSSTNTKCGIAILGISVACDLEPI